MLAGSGAVIVVFFFSSRRRHTRFDCDWSSDVCSSDLLQRQLGEQESTTRTQRTLELEQRRLAEQDRTRAAGILSDLQRERERALGYLESLQSAEGRRLILEGLAAELQRQGGGPGAGPARAGREPRRR